MPLAISSFLLILFLLFIYLMLVALGLCCCARAFSSGGEWGLLSAAVRGLLIVVAFLVEHRLRVCRLQYLQHEGSAVVAHGLRCSVSCGIFLDQGLNPCLLHWQADSYPLFHQGSPFSSFFHYVLPLLRNTILLSFCLWSLLNFS